MDEDAKEDATVTEPTAGEQTQPEKPKATIPHAKVVRAAELALKSSAKAAQALADAEDAQIKGALAQLIKLTLTKLELKMGQFEELEDILEEERRALESARLGLVNERVNLKRMLDGVRAEIARNGVGAGRRRRRRSGRAAPHGHDWARHARQRGRGFDCSERCWAGARW